MTGAKHDDGKPRWDLLPWLATSTVVDVLTYGANKPGYGANSWRSVPNGKARYMAAALRHIAKHAMGERVDPETGLPHLAHAACNLLFLVELDEAQLDAAPAATSELTAERRWAARNRVLEARLAQVREVIG